MTTKEALMVNNKTQLASSKQKVKYIEMYYDLVKVCDMVNHNWIIKIL